MVMPGEDAAFTVEMVKDVALEVRAADVMHLHYEKTLLSQVGQRFTVREGSKTVGTGVVTKILE